MKKILLIFILFISIFLYSTTYTVKQDGTGDYRQIQTAVDNANAGDTIRVYPGTYYENIEIFKDLSLVSNYEYTNDENYIKNTIIDGNHTGSCIYLKGTENQKIINYICGFTMRNGSGTCPYSHYSPDTRYGGGLQIRYSNLVIKKNIIEKNNAFMGGGILTFFSDITYKGNVIRYNKCSYFGGGIFIYSSNSNFSEEMLNSVFFNYGGNGNDLAYLESDFSNNTVYIDTFSVNTKNYYYVYSTNSSSYYR